MATIRATRGRFYEFIVCVDFDYDCRATGGDPSFVRMTISWEDNIVGDFIEESCFVCTFVVLLLILFMKGIFSFALMQKKQKIFMGLLLFFFVFMNLRFQA
jgi:Ca2+/Na+ antiporter